MKVSPFDSLTEGLKRLCAGGQAVSPSQPCVIVIIINTNNGQQATVTTGNNLRPPDLLPSCPLTVPSRSSHVPPGRGHHGPQAQDGAARGLRVHSGGVRHSRQVSQLHLQLRSDDRDPTGRARPSYCVARLINPGENDLNMLAQS